MVVGWTPTSLAKRRQLQCVASAGFSSRVLRTISASSSGVILRGRPERGRSSSSSSTPPLVPVEPLRDRRPRYAHLPADRRPRPSLGRAENDVGRPRVAVWSVCPSACVLLGATESYALGEESIACIYCTTDFCYTTLEGPPDQTGGREAWPKRQRPPPRSSRSVTGSSCAGG